jgi:hypothetical protein
MGIFGSIPFAHGYDDDDLPYEDEPPTRAEDEHALASVCKSVHEKCVTLPKFLVGSPRANVTELGELIGSVSWTEAAHTLLVGIWNSSAACWFCRAVQSQEEQKEEEKEAQVEDAVPWNPSMTVMDCALLIRSVASFDTCVFRRSCPTTEQTAWIRSLPRVYNVGDLLALPAAHNRCYPSCQRPCWRKTARAFQDR